jgi:hypothetical protein
MADFIVFDEGARELLNNGLPATCYFLLSTKSVDATSPHTAGETLSGATVGEITGTGYGRKNQAEPSASGRSVSFAQMNWATLTATDWPATVRSIVLATTSDNTGKAICAWNLLTGGGVRDMSGANTTLYVTPTLSA